MTLKLETFHLYKQKQTPEKAAPLLWYFFQRFFSLLSVNSSDSRVYNLPYDLFQTKILLEKWKQKKRLEQMVLETIDLNLHLSMLFGTPCNSRLHLVFHSSISFWMRLYYSFFRRLKIKEKLKFSWEIMWGFALIEYTRRMLRLLTFTILICLPKLNQQKELKNYIPRTLNEDQRRKK